jgi:uncharacterized membrane protein
MARTGAGFYFIALNPGRRKRPGLPEGAYGEEWEVRGCGLYQTTKVLVAPDRLPEHLTRDKWRSWMPWRTRGGLLAIVCWAAAERFLVDPVKLDLAARQAIALAAGFVVTGWLG